MNHNSGYVVFSYINGNREEIEVNTTSQYKWLASIHSVKPTIPKSQERFSWTQTQATKPGNFIIPLPLYSVKHKLVPMTILEPDYLYVVPSALTIHQTRTMDLGILEDNGSG